MDYQFIIHPKDSDEPHFITATTANKNKTWGKATIVALGEDIGDSINALTIEDMKTVILGKGGVLDTDVGIMKYLQFLLDKYMSNYSAIRKFLSFCFFRQERQYSCTRNRTILS